MSGLNVVSLFNGMGCIWLAMDKAGLPVAKRYSSEIDKPAIAVNDFNYPDTQQLGDVRHLKGKDLGFVHILAGGSPCQSFSFAGKRNGMSTVDDIEVLSLAHYLELKAQNFEFEGQSYLFWEYMRILKELQEINPEIEFLLENVMMSQKWQKILNKAIGINPVKIDSNLLSAQNRKRLYWTNMGAQPTGLFNHLTCQITQPKDQHIYLKDIVQHNVPAKYYLSDKAISSIISNTNNLQKSAINPAKANTLQSPGNACGVYKGANFIEDVPVCVAMRGRAAVLSPKRTEYGKSIRKEYEAGTVTEQRKNVQQLEPRTDGKTNTLTTVQKDNLVEIIGLDYRKDEGLRYRTNGKSGTLAARARNDESCGQLVSVKRIIRRLTPVECERLQTVPDNYTAIASDTQRYKMLGNGWTVDVIAHILGFSKYQKSETTAVIALNVK